MSMPVNSPTAPLYPFGCKTARFLIRMGRKPLANLQLVVQTFRTAAMAVFSDRGTSCYCIYATLFAKLPETLVALIESLEDFLGIYAACTRKKPGDEDTFGFLCLFQAASDDTLGSYKFLIFLYAKRCLLA